jgi:hypothetical protein
LLGTLAASFFLFAAKTAVPGGAAQFVRYAEAIVHGTTLAPDVAARDVGYPLLIVLSGLPFLHSLIPLILIQAGFAILLPLLVYEGLRRLSSRLAFQAGLLSIVTLYPFYFMKMIHHDQTYIFFSMLMLCQLLIFVQTGQIRFLYFFTAAAICASLARPAGNALFPLFVIAAYVAGRGKILHYVICTAVFGGALAAYSWHRYVIFDVVHDHATPSYLGEQIFYDPYVNALDYHIRLAPTEIGPNFTLAIEQLRTRLRPNPKDSEFLKEHYLGSTDARQFAEAHMFGLTPDQLIEQVLSQPNYEYYTLLCEANDDRVMLGAALEIARAHPDMILRYSVRNFFHFVFGSGYGHSRYDLSPSRPARVEFFPTGTYPEDIGSLPAQAAREANFDVFSPRPSALSLPLEAMRRACSEFYETAAGVFACLMIIAWATAAFSLARGGRSRTAAPNEAGAGKTPALTHEMSASIVVASLLFVYNAIITSAFAEPSFRYLMMTNLTAIVVAALGFASIRYWISFVPLRQFAPDLAGPLDRATQSIRSRDVWLRFTALQSTAIVVGLMATGFAAWALYILKNTLARD